jgi:hypothetical protein
MEPVVVRIDPELLDLVDAFVAGEQARHMPGEPRMQRSRAIRRLLCLGLQHVHRQRKKEKADG